MNKKAIYHPEAGRELEFEIIKENDNGTIDLAGRNAAGELVTVVESCIVTDEVVIGSATLPKETTKQRRKGAKTKNTK
jgi:hypothetical protein